MNSAEQNGNTLAGPEKNKLFKAFKTFFASFPRKHPFVLLCAASLLSALVCDYSADRLTVGFWLVAGAVLACTVFLAFYWHFHGGITAERAVILITAAAFTVKLAYVLLTGLGERQHDTGSFSSASHGHAGYIFRLYEGEGLPDSVISQFYHPPLHYTLEALWLRLLTLLGVGFETAKHYVTVLTLFYASASCLITYKIFRALGASAKGAAVAYAVMAFHPAFIIGAASYNNDILSVTLMLMSLLFLVRWWKNPSFFNIIMIAVGLGFGMMAKLSALYLAPAIACVFVIKFFAEKHKLKKIGEFALFAGISIPAGTWWSFRMLILFDKPLGYVMKLSDKLPQYVGFRSAAERIFAVAHSFSEGIFFARGEEFGNTFYEYNIPSAVLKTSVFGEWHFGDGYPVLEFAAHALLIINIVLIAVSLVCAVIAFIGKKGERRNLNRVVNLVILSVLYLAIAVTFVKFCFDYPHNCTMDFRYIVPTAVVGAAFISLFFAGKGRERTKLQKAAEICITVTAVLFCAASSVIFVFAA